MTPTARLFRFMAYICAGLTGAVMATGQVWFVVIGVIIVVTFESLAERA